MIKKRILLFFCGVCLWGSLFAQGLPLQMKGTVVNEYGEPLCDVLVMSENGKNEWMTGRDGVYILTVNDGSRFVTLSARGYKNLRVVAADNPVDRITLEFDNHHTSGYVNLGYFEQTKESLTGSVSTVSGAELDKAPVSILTETLSGRLSGLEIIQNLAEFNFAGYGNNTSLIRGITSVNGYKPTIIIDGIVCPNQYFEFLSPKEIESVSVLKDAATTAIYGIQGSGGVIAITTKRGYIGKKKVEFYVDQSFQQMTKRPQFVNSLQYAELRNQAGVNDGLGAYSQFSQEELEGFTSGDPLYYPNNDWYSMFVKNITMRQRVGVNVTGGSEKIKFFSNISYLHQEEPLKVTAEPDRKYDPTPEVHGVNFRSNIDVKFNDYLGAFMRLTGNVKHEQMAGGNLNRSIYTQIFNLPPTMYGPVTPIYEDDPEASNQVVTHDATESPVYGLLNRSGYRRVIETNVIAQSGLTLDMGFLAKGLSMSGSVAYQTYSRNETMTSQNFERWVRSNDLTQLSFTKKGSAENTPLGYSKGSVFFYHLNLLANINYQRRFDEHSIQAMGYTFYQQQEKEYGSGSEILPYKRQSSGLSVTYGYRDRYFLKGDIGYSGSEQFHPDHRYIATPAVSAAWIVSKEDFLSGIDVVSLLKLRASYGIVANDQLNGPRFLYLDYIDSQGNEGLKGNPSLSAEKIKKQNYGFDLGLLNQFTLGFDYYVYKVDNMLVSSNSTVPNYQGIPLGNYPRLNNGVMENKGFEIELGYDKHLTSDLSVYASLSFNSSKNKVIKVNEAAYAEDYPYRYHTEGYSIGQQWGYLIDYSNGNGMYNSQNELNDRRLTYSFGTPRVGDFIYYDLNNDGTIDAKDMAPIGYPSIPEQIYSLFGGLTYKNIEFSFMFQGVNKTSTFISGVGAYEKEYQGVFNDIHMNAWTQERYDAGEKIDYPALSLNTSVNHVSNSFFLMNGSYVRLKNVEIAYSLPVRISKKVGAERIRFALNAQNLFTIDKIPSKYIDPEIMSMSTFQPYRVYNIGVSLTF